MYCIFHGSESFQPLLCVRLIQLVRTEHHKPVVIISSSVSTVDKWKGWFSIPCPTKTDIYRSGVEMFRCCHCMLWFFPMFFHCLHSKTDCCKRTLKWKAPKLSSRAAQLFDLRVLTSKTRWLHFWRFFQLNIYNSWPWHEMVWLSPH